MPILDSCIDAIYEPGNIGASSGTTPIVIRPGSLYTPDSYPIDSVEYSFQFNKFYNGIYLGAL